MHRVRAVALGVIATMVLAMPTAGAQTPSTRPPPTPPPSVSPTTPPSSVGDLAPDVEELLAEAVLITAEKAAVLDLLGAFSEPMPPPLRSVIVAVDWDDTQTREQLLDELATLDTEGEDVLAELSAEVSLSREVVEVLTRTTADATRAQILDGATGVIIPGPYLSAIDDLVVRNGAAPDDGTRGVVDAAALIDAVNAAYEALDPSATTTVPDTTTPPDADDAPTTTDPSTIGSSSSESSSAGRTWLIVGLGALVVVALVGALVALRRGRPRASGAPFDELLDASRTLALARSRDEVEQKAAQQAARLLHSPEPATAAVVRRSANRLEIGYETLAGLLVPERVGDGLLARVVETGQGLTAVVDHEPALRSLPAALAAVPIIGGGRVEGVIMVVRTPDEPFTEHELDLLRKLGPITAASLDSARHADASAAASLTDPLTDVGNRRKLELDLQQVLETAIGPTALVMVDLDHFKVVNDTYGHPAGDALLRHVADALRDEVRPGDGVYRYGGEEFALVLPSTPEDEAADVADRARRQLRGGDIELGTVVVPAPTASLGVSATADANDRDGLALIARADRALYRAKQDGRDRVVVASDVDG